MAAPIIVADGWSIARATPPSRLHGANGIRGGSDGRIYVAQVCGSQVSAIDPDDGTIETISPMGGGIIGPDDLAFDDQGNIYCTEITTNRVSLLRRDGTTKVLSDQIHVANPITMYQDRLLVGELHMGGRIMELDRNTGDTRLVLGDVPMPNAFEVGPDGKLYFPVMAANEIWRVDLLGGVPEVVATGLGVPDSVKFDAQGFIVSTQIGSGEVLRINPGTGEKTVLAHIGSGLDNCAFVNGRLFVSHIAGGICEVMPDGTSRTLIDKGLQWPMGLAVNQDGRLYIADAMMGYCLMEGGVLEQVGSTITPGFPGTIRGVAADGLQDWLVTTTRGDVARWAPGGDAEILASGFKGLMGVAVGPNGAIVFCDQDTGRVLSFRQGRTDELATGLDRPSGIAVAADGTVLVAEAGAGRIVTIAHGRSETVTDGLGELHGIAIHKDELFALDVTCKQLIQCHLSGGSPRIVASRLPIGAPPGVLPKPLGGFGDMAGPMTPFAGLAVDPGGCLYVSADTDGSVLKVRTGKAEADG